MAKKRRSSKKRKEATSEELFHSSRDQRVNRRREHKGVLPRKVIIGLILLVVFLFFLPSIVVRTPLKQVLINRAFSDFHGKVTVESISCGWIANTQLTNVRAVDEEGELLFSIGRVRLRKSLTSMINASDLGTIEISQPIVNLKLRSDGSNLEDAIADMLAGETGDEPSPSMKLSIADARALVTDVASGHKYELENLNSNINLFQPAEAPLTIDVDGSLDDATDDRTGTIKARLVIDAGNEELEFANGLVELESENFPIEIATPFLTRFVEPMTIAGSLDNGKVSLAWSNFGSSINVQMQPANLSELTVTAPSRIGSDRIQLKNAWLQGELTLTPDQLMAEKFVCNTDVGSLNAKGTMNWEQLSAVAGAQIPANNFQADGTLNLAELIGMLPETMPLQEGVQIESGTVQFDASSRLEGSDRRLVVNVESPGLTAIHHGKRLNWDKPARVVAAVRQTSDNRIYVESLDCVTDFLTLNGTATSEQGEFRLQGDLKKALGQVKQFFDLGDVQIEGIVDGRFTWKFEGRPTDNLTSRPLNTDGEFQIERPLVNLPGQTSWAEDEINIVFQAVGQMLPKTTVQEGAIRLDSGTLKLINSRQGFVATLREPVTNPSLDSTWFLDCQIGGNVQTWLAQISTFMPLQARASGQLNANAELMIDPNRVTVHKSSYEFQDLQLAGYGVAIQEEHLAGDARMDYQIGTGVLQIAELSMNSSAIVARAQEMVVDSRDMNGKLSGQIAFQGDVNRCLAMFAGAPKSDAIHWYGQASGTINLETTTESIGGAVEIQLEDLVATQLQPFQPGVRNVSSAGQQWKRLLDEKVVSLDSRLNMSRSFDQLSFKNTTLNSSAAEVVASGSLSDLGGLMNADIRGTWKPNWQRLKPLVDSMLGGMASIDGVQGGDFELRGPVFNGATNPTSTTQADTSWLNPALQMSAVANWQTGQVLGMNVGGSQVNVRLAEAVASMDTQPISVGQSGIARLNPRINLGGPEMVLSLPPGRVLENIQLTPELCRGWMKYVAPMLADATEAQGSFSIDTELVQVPLSRLAAANVNGRATLHGANVGPGPLSQKLITVVSQVKLLAKGQPLGAVSTDANATWINLPEQQIPFAVQQGRVFHQGMQFQIDDVMIQTSGSVGIDHTLQLVALVPILDSWVGNSRWTQGLKGQSLQIPIGGTVSKPQVDNRALQQISQQLLKQAAGSAIQTEVQGQVQGLIEQGNQRLEKEITNGLKGLLGGDR